MARSRTNKQKDTRKRARQSHISTAELRSLGLKAAKTNKIVAPSFINTNDTHPKTPEHPKPTNIEDNGTTPEFMAIDSPFVEFVEKIKTPADESIYSELPNLLSDHSSFPESYYFRNSAYTFESLGYLPILPEWNELPSVDLFEGQYALPKVSTDNELLALPENIAHDDKAASPLVKNTVFATEGRATRNSGKKKSIEQASQDAEQELDIAALTTSKKFKKKK